MHCEFYRNPSSVWLTVKVNGEVKVKCSLWKKEYCAAKTEKNGVKRVGEILNLSRQGLDIVQL